MHALKRYTNTLFCSAILLGMTLIAGCGGGGDQGRDAVLGLPASALVSIAVTPATATVAIGASQQFTATATYADGSLHDVTAAAAWTSATPADATVNPGSGLSTGISGGNSVISAAFNGKSASATLTVTPASVPPVVAPPPVVPVLTAMTLLPANPRIGVGASQQFIAMGTFDNGATRDITASSTFVSASPAVARIGAADGLAIGVTAGQSLVTASSGALNASTTLTVTPAALVSIALTPLNPIVQIGATRQLAVTATYADNSTGDVTLSSAFASASAANASVAPATGLVTGVSAGTALVSASIGGQTASTTVTVPAATLLSIAVTPATASIAIGATQQFVATGTYSDNSTAIISNTANWTSATIATGTIVPGGLATGVAAGATNISAALSGKSGSAVLTVLAAAPPPVATLDLGRASNFGVLAGTSLTNNSGGTTLITGDVGSPSQTTDPTLSPGFVNYKSGAVLNGALADLQVAITDGNSRACDVTFASNIDLGGLVLAPGVYCYAGSISITGTLKLSGSGLYIFRTALTLNSTANSTVALSNGADAEHVFWIPTGPSTLGANSAFKGSILGQSAAITVGDNTTLLNGRVLSAAAVTLSNNQIAK